MFNAERTKRKVNQAIWLYLYLLANSSKAPTGLRVPFDGREIEDRQIANAFKCSERLIVMWREKLRGHLIHAQRGRYRNGWRYQIAVDLFDLLEQQ